MAETVSADVEYYLRHWSLKADGAVFTTATSILAPVRRDNRPLMLKIATEPEEQRGNRLMTWWRGRGAARVLERDDRTVLLERAVGTRSLTRFADAGGLADDVASAILCRVGSRLHAIDDEPPAGLIDLTTWFRDLFEHAETAGGFFAHAAQLAGELLRSQREVVVLHGDLHHGNVLDFGPERHRQCDGWLAIDPKYLIGDRAFDFTNILCNPNGRSATRPGRLAHQVEIIAETARVDRVRLLSWTVAWCALSATWGARDGSDSHDGHALAVGIEAERLLNRL